MLKIFILLTVSYTLMHIRNLIKKVWIKNLLFFMGMTLFSWCSTKISMKFNSLSDSESIKLLIFYTLYSIFLLIVLNYLSRMHKNKQK